MVIMNRLRTAQRVAVVKALVEGNSIRSTVRLTGVAKNTVTKLLLEIGAVCAEYQDKTIKNLTSQRVQCDEIWSFCYAKARAVKLDPSILERNADAGDVWTWTAIDADTKLCITFAVGNRSSQMAYTVIGDLASRLSNRIQLSTDNLRSYFGPVEKAFGVDVDYGLVEKIYSGSNHAGRYSPPECVGCKKVVMTGAPDPDHISTSYVERVNLSMRMGMRRFTRLTNAFSRKVENHMAAVSLFFMYYNFGRVHQTLRVTPAMEAGLADHVWSVEEIVKLLGD